jgi:hypothetical protein
MYDFGLVMMLAFAVVYYRIGETEYQKGLLLGALSILVWLATSFLLHWGWLGSIGAQIGIFAVLTIINMFRKPGFK